MIMKQFKLHLLCCLLIGVIWTVRADGTPNWQLPTAEAVQHSLQSCQAQAAGEAANTLRCLTKQLGLWSDVDGFKAKRIAHMFAERHQMEELIVVIDYCNNREQRKEQPAQWAYAAYKCATAGRFGRWVEEYMNNIK